MAGKKARESIKLWSFLLGTLGVIFGLGAYRVAIDLIKLIQAFQGVTT